MPPYSTVHFVIAHSREPEGPTAIAEEATVVLADVAVASDVHATRRVSRVAMPFRARSRRLDTLGAAPPMGFPSVRRSCILRLAKYLRYNSDTHRDQVRVLSPETSFLQRNSMRSVLPQVIGCFACMLNPSCPLGNRACLSLLVHRRLLAVRSSVRRPREAALAATAVPEAACRSMLPRLVAIERMRRGQGALDLRQMALGTRRPDADPEFRVLCLRERQYQHLPAECDSWYPVWSGERAGHRGGCPFAGGHRRRCEFCEGA